jgi:hypothetical protein
MKKFYFSLLAFLLVHLNLFATDSTKTKAPDSFLKNRIREAITNHGRAKLDLYVMSYCPYGINAEKLIVPILQEMADSIDFNLFFIADEMSNGEFQSLHGEPEILENRRQLVILRHFPKNFHEYLLHRVSNYLSANWEASALEAGIEIDGINKLMNDQDELEAFSKNIHFGNSNNIFASPTLFINGISYEGPFSSATNTLAWGTCEEGPSKNEPCDDNDGCHKFCVGGNRDKLACISADHLTKGCPGRCVGGTFDNLDCWGKFPDECRLGTCVNFANTCKVAQCVGVVCCGPNGCVKGISEEQCRQTSGDGKWFSRATCEICGSLRISINVESFQGNYSDQTKQVQLSWRLEPVMAGKEFYVQRSRDGERFKDISFLKAGDLVNGAYQFTDIDPYDIGYYRILFQGREQLIYSQVATVVGVKSGKLYLLPNPAKESVRVLLSNMQQFVTEVSVTDLSGRLVLRKTLTMGQNELDISGLGAGMYIVRAAFNGQVYTSKLIKK